MAERISDIDEDLSLIIIGYMADITHQIIKILPIHFRDDPCRPT